MKVEIQHKKFVKPSLPTFPSLYPISFTDELAPTIQVPLIIYYPPPKLQNGTTTLSHLEKSLELTLDKFHPLVGRYIKTKRVIDCNNQGVEFVHAKADVHLTKLLAQGVTPDMLNNFLPCEIGASDEITDPLLAIQVTMFECGGLGVGMCFSHRVSDMSTMDTFIDYWAGLSRDNNDELAVGPIFNSAQIFPGRGLPELDLRVPRSSIGVQNAVKKFSFNGKAISTLRAKVGVEDTGKRKPSKVQAVVALLWKVLVHNDKVRNGHSKASFVIQPVNLRDKIVPPLPQNSCGNFWGLATTQLKASERDNMEFQDYLALLRSSIRKMVKDCANTLSNGEDSCGVVINPYLEANRNIANSEVKFYLFTSWNKFSFYEADFGWGKPIWASTGKLPVKNLTILMDDKDGDGVEAWVHLDEKDMVELEKDPEIRAFISTTSSI